ncbi:MAG TPA: hypothetical protein VGI65_19310 [Steroidobacteraceae bacterium]
MNFRNIIWAGIFAIAACAVIRPARAADVLYNQSGFLRDQQAFVQSFDVSGPGVLTITLSNIAWPEQLASLNVVVGTSGGLLGPEMGAGSESFDLAGGGRIFAQWFGAAQGPLDMGVYGLYIAFTPSGSNPVPLPPSLMLLVSGLALLAWSRRHRLQP